MHARIRPHATVPFFFLSKNGTELSSLTFSMHAWSVHASMVSDKIYLLYFQSIIDRLYFQFQGSAELLARCECSNYIKCCITVVEQLNELQLKLKMISLAPDRGSCKFAFICRGLLTFLINKAGFFELTAGSYTRHDQQ